MMLSRRLMPVVATTARQAVARRSALVYVPQRTQADAKPSDDKPPAAPAKQAPPQAAPPAAEGSSLVRSAILSLTQSISNFFTAINPVKRLGPSDVWVLQYANGKHRVLGQGLNYRSPLASVIFRGNLVQHNVSLPASPCRTLDNVTVLTSPLFVFKVAAVEDLSNLGADLNQWLDGQCQSVLVRALRNVSVADLFSDMEDVEEDMRKQISKLAGKYGLECQAVLLKELLPPPDVLFEFERLAADVLSAKFETKQMEEAQKMKQRLMEEQNDFIMRQTKDMVTGYRGMLDELAPHFKSDEGVRAAEALSNPNFLAPMRQMHKEMGGSFGLEESGNQNNLTRE